MERWKDGKVEEWKTEDRRNGRMEWWMLVARCSMLDNRMLEFGICILEFVFSIPVYNV
jgi:hypothetical protein